MGFQASGRDDVTVVLHVDAELTCVMVREWPFALQDGRGND